MDAYSTKIDKRNSSVSDSNNIKNDSSNDDIKGFNKNNQNSYSNNNSYNDDNTNNSYNDNSENTNSSYNDNSNLINSNYRDDWTMYNSEKSGNSPVFINLAAHNDNKRVEATSSKTGQTGSVWYKGVPISRDQITPNTYDPFERLNHLRSFHRKSDSPETETATPSSSEKQELYYPNYNPEN